MPDQPAGLPVTVTSLASPTSTSLDPEETNADPTPPPASPTPDHSTPFRHSGWAADRSKVRTALAALANDPLALKPDGKPLVSSRRHLAFCQCGQDAYVDHRTFGSIQQNDHRTHLAPGAGWTEYRVRAAYCHDRFCVPCSNARAARIRNALLAHLYERNRAKNTLSLITLTLAGHKQDLATLMDRAHAHFRELRATPIWQAVRGGCAILECKLTAPKNAAAAGPDGKRWHLHWHIVCEAKYLPQEDLSATWRMLTKDSIIVDVRRVGSLAGATSYVTKYVTKAADHSILEDQTRLQEAIKAFTGRRLVTTFGTWRGLQLLPDDFKEYNDDTKGPPWQTIGPLDEIIEAANKGDPAAARILHLLKRRRPTPRAAAPPPS